VRPPLARRLHAISARCLGSIAVLALALPAHAEAPAAGAEGELPVYDVYVTTPRDLVDRVPVTRSVDRQDLAQENARTLDEALVHVPNVVVRTGGDGVPRIDVRGLRSRHLLLLLDGVPFNATADGQFDASLLPTQLIERVDLVSGNGSVLYGDGGIGGVLQVRTRRAGEASEGTASFEVRERGQYQPELSVSGEGERFETFAAGRYLSSKGYPLPDGFDGTTVENGDLRENAERQQGNLFARIGHRPTKTSRIDLLAEYRKGSFGVPPNVVDDPDDRFAARTRFERVERFEGFSTQLSGHLDPVGPLSLRGWTWVNRQEERRQRYDDEGFDSLSRNGSFAIDETALRAGGSVHGRYDFGDRGALRFGINGRYEGFEAEGFECSTGGGGGGGGGSNGVGGGNGGGGGGTCGSDAGDAPFSLVDTDEAIGIWSLGVEHEIEPVENLALVVGYAHAFLEGDGGVGDDGSIFLAGATHTFETDTRLRGSAAHKIRMPSVLQLYDPESGNLDLDTERCWCFEVAVEQSLPRGSSVELAGFWQELRGFIERDEDRIFQNRQELRLRGIELSAASRPLDPVEVRFAYAWLHTRDLSSDRDFPRLSNRPEHTIDLEVRYAHPWDGDLRLAMRHLRGMEEDSRNTPELRTLDAFTTVDTRLAQRFLEDRIELYVGVDNLFDAEGEVNLGFPVPGRTLIGGGSVRF